MPRTHESDHLRIHAFVISWTGWDAAAARIADGLRPHVEQLTVIHSDGTGRAPTAPHEWDIVPDSHFYGMKFRRSLDLFTDDVMLQVQADAQSADWGLLVAAARRGFETRPSLGVWAPDVSFTPLPTRLTRLATAAGTLEHVAIIDGIVWALSRRVCTRLRAFDYSRNNIGWGIDWAAACYSHATGLEVIVDTAVTVEHPMSRGYATESALDQMGVFLGDLTDHEDAMRGLIRGYLAPRRGDHPIRDAVIRAARDGRHRLRELVDRVAGRTAIPGRPVPPPEL